MTSKVKARVINNVKHRVKMCTGAGHITFQKCSLLHILSKNARIKIYKTIILKRFIFNLKVFFEKYPT
jgi:hypothetical protein